MRTKCFKAILLPLIILSLTALSLLTVSTASTEGGLTPHDPIYIEGNDNFTLANGVTSGSGTASDPYIIENWDINAENAHGIEIRNTDAHFIIRNCYVHDGKSYYYPYPPSHPCENIYLPEGNSGIWFLRVINGKIYNTTSDNNADGIFLVESSYNNISNNVMERNSTGIGCSRWSNNNLVSNNTVRGYNYFGILITGSSNLISNNLVENCGERVIMTPPRTGYHPRTGIYLGGKSENNVVSNNLVVNSGEFGIDLVSDNNLISSNLVENNHFGICISSSNNTISNNLVKNNSNGMVVGYRMVTGTQYNNNTIFHNNFLNNENQAHDEYSNYWDNGYPSGGNYWSDYTGVDADGDGIGDTPYEIPGDNNQDRYPLMNPIGEVPPAPAPTGEGNWPLIAGIIGVVVVIGIGLTIYLKRR